MMVGLPAAGKTVLAQNHCRENEDKHFTILGRDLIFDRMKVIQVAVILPIFPNSLVFLLFHVSSFLKQFCYKVKVPP